MITRGSRYVMTMLYYDATQVPQRLAALGFDDSISSEYTLYQTADGDTYQRLAGNFYRNPSLWWKIANMNPQIIYPDNIPGGTVIRIPKV